MLGRVGRDILIRHALSLVMLAGNVFAPFYTSDQNRTLLDSQSQPSKSHAFVRVRCLTPSRISAGHRVVVGLNRGGAGRLDLKPAGLALGPCYPSPAGETRSTKSHLTHCPIDTHPRC